MNGNYKNMSLEELGGVVKSALACMYDKLREDECFGCDTMLHVKSIGSEEYDVELAFIDSFSSSSGNDWPRCWIV